MSDVNIGKVSVNVNSAILTGLVDPKISDNPFAAAKDDMAVAENAPITVTKDGNGNITKSYLNSAGQATKVTDSLGLISETKYDPTSDLPTEVTKYLSATVSNVTDYSYDDRGRVTQMVKGLTFPGVRSGPRTTYEYERIAAR